MNDLANLTIRIQSTSAVAASKDLDTLTKTAVGAETATNSLSASTTRLDKSFAALERDVTSLEKSLGIASGRGRTFATVTKDLDRSFAALERDVTTFERSLDRAYVTQGRFAATAQQAYAAQRRQQEAARGAAVATESASRATMLYDRNGQRVARTLILMSSAMDVFGGTSDDATRKVLGGAAKIASAYALGGPVFGSIIAGLEVFSFLQQEADKFFKFLQRGSPIVNRALATTDQLMEDMRSRETPVERLNREIDELIGKISTLETAMGRLQAPTRSRGSIQADINKLDEDYNSLPGFSLTGRSKFFAQPRYVKERRALERELATVVNPVVMDREKDATKEILAIRREQLRVEEALREQRLDVSSIENQTVNMLLAAKGRKENELVLETRLSEITKQIGSLTRANSKVFDEQLEILYRQAEAYGAQLEVVRKLNELNRQRTERRELELLRAVTGELRDQVQLVHQVEGFLEEGRSKGFITEFVALKNREPVIRFAQDTFEIVSGALSDGIVDGIYNGFENGADIVLRASQTYVKMVVDTWLQKGVNQALTATFNGGLLQNAFGALSGAQAFNPLPQAQAATAAFQAGVTAAGATFAASATVAATTFQAGVTAAGATLVASATQAAAIMGLSNLAGAATSAVPAAVAPLVAAPAAIPGVPLPSVGGGGIGCGPGG